MKTKIISLLVVVALVVAMAVPVFADDTYTLSGKWRFNETVTMPSETLSASVGFTLEDGSHFSKITFFNTEPTLYYLTDGGNNWNACNSNGVVFEARRLITFDNEQTVSADFYNWFVANASPATCDGSTCPATDVNQDNVCDDCGMTFAVPRVYGPPDAYTVWTEERQAIYSYALIYTNESGAHYLIMSKAPATYEDGAIVFRDVNHVVYTVFDGSWRLHQSYDEAYSSYGSVVDVYPSYNMRDAEGLIVYQYNSDFFPIPLWAQMGMVTQGEMGQLILEMVGTTKVLVLCGVGLMALLVVLSLFGKRSLIFRN